MRIKIREYLVHGKKSVSFQKDGDTFWVNKKFIEKKNHSVYAVFPSWATQIYVKHNNSMYEIFLKDFQDYIENNIPIPFENHFPKKLEKPKQAKIKKTYKVVEVEYKPVIADYKSQVVESYSQKISIEPTHDELVLARRNGEI